MTRKLSKIIQRLFIFLLIFVWFFSGWPRIWPLGGFDKLTTSELGVNKIRIPPQIQEASMVLFTVLLFYFFKKLAIIEAV